MRPIVNGIEADYIDELSVRHFNAAADDADLFSALTLPGHPAVVIVSPDGRELYRGYGIIEETELRARVEEALASAD